MPEVPLPTHEAAAHERSDPVGGRIGMWLFLYTELLLFGVLFLAYAVYMSKYKFDFRSASRLLDKHLGAINTAVLLTSSLTMALAIGALRRGDRRLCLRMIAVTLLFAAAFLGVKAFEWGAKFEHGILPQSAAVLERPPGEQIFIGLYFTMTGLHALHVLAGAAVIAMAAVLVRRGRTNAQRPAFLENVGLYWHIVDIVWIFLFPLFYLIA
jgi:cytochrome c oxidase subunit III